MWMFENILIEVEGVSCEMKWQYVIILRKSPGKFLIILIIIESGNSENLHKSKIFPKMSTTMSSADRL
jgi:hypothetical protein